ncbi:MAG: hypothetical protein IKK33_07560 [Lachnospiraceae bacterium]|nr:hypothetical protein [Lachnospiraceae bacterium]
MSRKNADKNANTLCWISLICLIAPFILSTLMAKLVLATGGSIIGGLIVFINSLMDILFVVARISGVVLMIYVRINHPQNVFGKVLMWIYIIILVVIILFFIFVVVLCNGCIGGIENCANARSFCS